VVKKVSLEEYCAQRVSTFILIPPTTQFDKNCTETFAGEDSILQKIMRANSLLQYPTATSKKTAAERTIWMYFLPILVQFRLLWE
jgi:hypothetical protein